MFSKTSLLTAILLAGSIHASPILVRDAPSVGLPFATSLNLTGKTLPEIDRARAAHLLAQGQHLHGLDVNGTLGQTVDDVSNFDKRSSSFGVTNTAITYTANVNIGSPATSYTLLIDTGSSNTWVGAGKQYAATSSSKATGKRVAVSYGSGSFSGHEYTDTVSLSSSLTINQQSIGVASSTSGMYNVDGILGIGPVALTHGTVEGSSTVPTVTDNLFSQKKISSEVIGISYNPTNTYSTANGELTFGGVDDSKHTGSINYTPITQTSPSKYYWGVDQTITYGYSHGLFQGSGIVDTGTTLILLASDAFEKYKDITGAVEDNNTGLLKLTKDQFAILRSLNFNIGGTNYELTANAQIWPRALNQYIGGNKDDIYLIVGDLGYKSGKGLDFINGYTFLERFYSVYDTTNSRVGLAYTSNTKSTIN